MGAGPCPAVPPGGRGDYSAIEGTLISSVMKPGRGLAVTFKLILDLLWR